MGTNEETLAPLTNVLDRAAATAAPFSEAGEDAQGQLSNALGLPSLTATIGADGRPMVPGSVLLGIALLLEMAIGQLSSATGAEREAVIFGIREHLAALLPPGDG